MPPGFPQAGLQLVLQGQQGFQAGLKSAGQAVQSFTSATSKTGGGFLNDLKSAGSNVNSFLSSMSKGLGGMNVFSGALSRLGNEMTILGRAATYVGIYRIFQGMGDLTSQIYESVAGYDLLRSSLEAMTARDLVRAGAAESVNQAYGKATEIVQNELFPWLEKLAIASRFDTASIASVYQLGATYGFTRQQLVPLVQTLVDWGSATGRTEMDMLGTIRAMGQIQQAGKFMGQELLQLSNHGVPALQYLAEAFHVPEAAARAMITEGAIPANEALQAIADGMTRDYGGATIKFASTITGLTTSLQDLISINLREFGFGIADGILPYLSELVSWLQTPEVREGFKKLGEQVGGAISNFLAIGQAIFSTEDPLRTLAGMIDSEVLPGFLNFFDQLRRFGSTFGEIASEAFQWGANIILQLGEGMIAAATEVMSALTYIGNIITEWLEPGSPPKLLPDLPDWGKSAMGEWVKGMSDVDISDFLDIRNTIKTAFENLIPSGGMDQGSVIPSLMDLQVPLSTAFSEIQRVGIVTSSTLDQITVASGPASSSVLDLLDAYQSWMQTSTQITAIQKELSKAESDVTEAQNALNKATEKYDKILSPLQDRLSQLQNLDETAKEEKDLAKWRKIAASDGYSAAKKAEALREIEKIELERKIRQVERERDVNITAAEAKVDAAKLEVDTVNTRLDAAKQAEIAAKSELDNVKARIDFEADQNRLIQEQLDLVESLQKAEEEAANASVSSSTKKSSAAKKAKDEAEKLAKAEFNLALAQEDTAGQLALYEERLNSLKPGTVEYIETQKKIIELREKLAKEQEKASDKEAKAQDQLSDAQFEAELAGKSHEERLALLQERLKTLTPNTKEYYDMLKRVRNEEEALNNERERSSKSKKGVPSAGKPFTPTAAPLGEVGGIGGLSDVVQRAKDRIANLDRGMADLGRRGTEISAQLAPLKDLFIGIAAVIGGVLLYSLGSLIVTTAAAAAPFLAVAAALAGLKLAWDTNFGGIRDVTDQVWKGTVKPALDALGETILGLFPGTTNLSDLWEKQLKPAFEAVGKFLVEILVPVIGGLLADAIWVVVGTIQVLQFTWENILKPVFDAIYGFIVEQLIPGFESWKNWFENELPEGISKFQGDLSWFWEGTVKPFWSWLTGPLVKSFSDWKNWFEKELPEAISKLQGDFSWFWEMTVKPFWSFLTTQFSDAWDSIGRFFTESIPNAISTAKSKFDEIWKQLINWKDFLIKGFLDALKSVRDMIGNEVSSKVESLKGKIGELWDKFTGLKDFLVGSFFRGLEVLRDYLGGEFADKLSWLKSNILDPIKSSFNHIKDAIGYVIGKIAEFIQKLSEVKVPDWLQGHSPPPMANWFSDIGSSASMAADVALPRFRMELDLARKTIPMPSSSMGSSSSTVTTNQYTYSPVYGSQSGNPRVDISNFAVLRSLAI